MTYTTGLRTAALAWSLQLAVLIGATPATAAVMTFDFMKYADSQSYSEDGIAATFADNIIFELAEPGEKIDSFLFFPYYSVTTRIDFTMAGPFSAKSLDLFGDSGFLDCSVSSRGIASACKPSSYPQGEAFFNVIGQKTDGQVVHAMFDQSWGTLELGLEFSNLSKLSVELNLGPVVLSPLPYKPGYDYGYTWGVAQFDYPLGNGQFVADPQQGLIGYDNNGNALYQEGIYTFADCDKNCFAATVDNVVLVPWVPVAPVPLPATAGLSILGLVALALLGRNRRRGTPTV